MLQPHTLSTRRPRSWVVFLAFTAAFGTLQLAHNGHLFTQPVYEDLDYAANSLLVLKAKRLELLHGHYSRMGFYHPGPALLYVLAAAEWTLFDVAGAVPTPHNAHMIAHLFLNAALLGAALTIVARGAGLRAATAAALVFLVYFAREGHLNSHWFAQTFFLVYLPFQIAAASVAAGRTAHLGWLALTASLAVHSHASFVMFVVPISLYALIRVWPRGPRVELAARERLAWITFAVVVGLFVLPIVLHTALHYPGEIRGYVNYRKPAAHGGLSDAGRFLVRTLTNDSRFGWPLAAGVAVGAVVSALTFPARGRRFVRQFVVVGALSTGAMSYYALRGVDDYQHIYLGVFFGSVLLLGWALIVMRLALLCRSAASRASAVVVGAGVAVWAGATGSFANPYTGTPGAPALADAICADPRWESGPPLMTIDGDGWTEAGALLIQLERRGKRPWLLDPQWHVTYTDAFRPDNRSVSAMWHLDAAGKSSSTIPARRVLAEFVATTIRELETRCALGEPVPLGGRGRRPGAKPIAGWAICDDERLFPVARESVALIDLDACSARAVRFALTARVIGPTPGAQRVEIAVNGEPVGEVAFDSADPAERSVVFPAEVLNRRSPVQVTFTFPDAAGYRMRLAPRPRPVYSVEIHKLLCTPLP